MNPKVCRSQARSRVGRRLCSHIVEALRTKLFFRSRRCCDRDRDRRSFFLGRGGASALRAAPVIIATKAPKPSGDAEQASAQPRRSRGASASRLADGATTVFTRQATYRSGSCVARETSAWDLRNAAVLRHDSRHDISADDFARHSARSPVREMVGALSAAVTRAHVSTSYQFGLLTLILRSSTRDSRVTSAGATSGSARCHSLLFTIGKFAIGSI